jgi:predicted Zn-dependent protease
MLTEGEAKSVLKSALEHTDADEAEASLGGGSFSLTRFANNTIHQNVSEERYELSVRVTYGARTARATTSSLEAAAIAGAVQRAQEMAKRSSPLEDLLPMAEGAGTPSKECYSPATADAAAETRAAMAGAVIERCRKKGLSAAGIVATGEGAFAEYGELTPFAVMNTKSLFLYHKLTQAQFSTTVHAEGSSGWAAATSSDVGDIDAPGLAEVAVEKALMGVNPKPLEPGRYDVVLEPEAVSNLLWFLCEGFGALAVKEGRSFLTDKLGDKIVGEDICLSDDVYHPLHVGVPFDWEGVEKRRVRLIEDGVARAVVHDRMTAKGEGVESTGHGLPVPNTEGPLASHLVMKGGEKKLEDLIASVERGVLVTRFWYTRVVDPIKVIITGMTRDGTFLIEKGKISFPLINMRFNESVLNMLGAVEGMTGQAIATGLVVPGLKARGFAFSSGTSF